MTNIAYTTNDFLLTEGRETVSFTSNAATSIAITGITGAIRSALTRRQLAGVGTLGIEPSDVNFSLPASQLVDAGNGNALVEPEQGDTITDADSIAFTIQQVTYSKPHRVYSCVCRRQK